MTFCAGCCIRTPSGGNILLARGAFPDDSGTVDLPIGRDEAAPTKRAITPDGQPSRTEYTVLERFPAGALLRVRPAHGAHAPDPRTWRPSATRSLATLSTARRTICSPARPSTRRIFRSATPSPGKRWSSPPAAGRSRKRWRRSAAEAPPPPAGSTGSGGGVIIENSYPEYTRCRCGGSRAFRIPRGSRAFRCVSLW